MSKAEKTFLQALRFYPLVVLFAIDLAFVHYHKQTDFDTQVFIAFGVMYLNRYCFKAFDEMPKID